jgi:hypothetical protein
MKLTEKEVKKLRASQRLGFTYRLIDYFLNQNLCALCKEREAGLRRIFFNEFITFPRLWGVITIVVPEVKVSTGFKALTGHSNHCS